MFDRLVFTKDRMLLDDLTFRLEEAKDDRWELGEECFRFYKGKPQIDLYREFLAGRAQFHPQNIVELGIWDGGSVAFWNECFQPRKLVAIDIARKQDSGYFQRYLTSKGLTDRVKTYWGVDQGDSARVRRIVATEFGAEIDLVIDDASHLYGPTKSSFETLFPLLRPGGLLIIEDWPWAYNETFHSPDHMWAAERPLADLILQAVEVAGSDPGIISSVTVNFAFVAIERGWTDAAQLREFRLEDFISRKRRG